MALAMKQVVVVDETLRLPRGKLAAQVAHASVGALLAASDQARRDWLAVGMPKIVVRCESAEDLTAIEMAARAAGLPCLLVRDAGHTVVAPGTPTCIGIGPAESAAIDAITGALTLVR